VFQLASAKSNNGIEALFNQISKKILDKKLQGEEFK